MLSRMFLAFVALHPCCLTSMMTILDMGSEGQKTFTIGTDSMS